MKIVDEIKLDFSDVLLQPKMSEYSSRSEVNLEREMMFKYSNEKWKGVPLMVSNMDSTGTIEMARALQEKKVITCLHKYYTYEDIPADLDKEYYAVTSGMDITNLREIMEKIDPKIICLDVANGYMKKFVELCAKVRELYPTKIIIGGNVCTSEGVLDLVMNGKVDIVKVGIGNGSCCTTRKQTGIGYPQLSAVIECSDTAHGINAHIISDGGVQVIGDFSKGFAGGADFIMSGSMYAAHDESNGEIITKMTNLGREKYKIYYGMSSKIAMEKYNGGVAKYKSSEGKAVILKYRGPIEETINEIMGGIRSTMTYIGAKKVKDIPKCSTFIRVNRQLNEIYNKNEIS